MLVQFSVKNFKTFKNKVTLSLVASNYDKSNLENKNVFDIEHYSHRLLKSAVVYGANASGKTSLLDGLAEMKWLVINSSIKTQIGDEIYYKPFKLSQETEQIPSEMEVIFVKNKIQYRYGFEITNKKIVSEWLFQKKINNKPKEVEIFYREDLDVRYHKLFDKVKKFDKEVGIIRENALILSISNMLKINESRDILEWFKDLDFFLGNDHHDYIDTAVLEIKQETSVGREIINIIKKFDIGIEDIKIIEETNDVTNTKNEIIVDIESYHKKYDKDYNFIKNERFSFMTDESSGTQKLFAILGYTLNVIKHGGVIIIDELDSKLHSNIVSYLIKLFNSKDTNPNNAQLIFNTHNTNLLNDNLFRRDQIWFTQKNRYGEANLFSLAEIKVRNDENFEDNYLEGRYGGIPYLEDISDLFKEG